MQESSVYQHLLPDKQEKNITNADYNKVYAKMLLHLSWVSLSISFDSNAVLLLLPTMENIDDVNFLRQLLDAALRVEDLETFVQILETNES